MAMRTEIRYINAYVSGTAAPQTVERPRPKSNVRLPKAKKPQKRLIQVDMVSLAGIATALLLAVMLVVGLVQMNQARQEAKMYKEYALSLRQENAQLRDTYHSSYDLEEVRKISAAMGMVPADQVEHIQMEVTPPRQEQEMNAWESFWSFFVGMFA